MSLCRAPLFLSAQLASAAVELVGTGAATHDVLEFQHCELERHEEGEHAAHVLFIEDRSGRAVWVFWHPAETRVQVREPCTGRNDAQNICLLYARHTGGHLWPEDAACLVDVPRHPLSSIGTGGGWSPLRTNGTGTTVEWRRRAPMSSTLAHGGDKLPGEPYPGPHQPPTPGGGPSVPNPPKAD